MLRVIDANSNRAIEGLRVIEQYLRFVLEDRHLTGVCKELRHSLAAGLCVIPALQRVIARETLRDVGTDVKVESEYRRGGLREVAVANQKRVEQSLRCLEEYTKTAWPELAAQLEQLRYRTYTLGRAFELTAASRQRLAAARLYVLLDGGTSSEDLRRRSQALVAAGVAILQLRDKTLDDGTLLERARLLREVTRQGQALLIVNDRPDIAVLADADGVHVGQDELSVKDARQVVGVDRMVGVSTHSITQARRAVLEGASYIGCGPTFPTPTKTFPSFPGLENLRQVAREISLPAFAIGGIGLQNLPEVLGTGFRRIAVASAIAGQADPAPRVRGLLAELSSAAVLKEPATK